MGEYVVKGSETIPIYKFEVGETIDFSNVPYTKIELPFDDYPIPSTDPVTVWSGGGGNLKTYGVNNSNTSPWIVTKTTMIGSSVVATDQSISAWYNMQRGAPIYIWAFVLPDNSFRIHAYPYYYDDPTWAIHAINNGYDSNGDALYVGVWDETSPLIEYEGEWDETPSSNPNDPTNLDAIGGEFADTDPFGFGNTDIDLPNAIQEMDYSGFITPYKLDNGGLFALSGAIFSSDTWTTLRNKFNGVGNPIDYIVSCVEIPYSADADANKNFNLGGVDVVNGSGGNVSLPYFTHRYEQLNFGTIRLKETWGTEKDYSTTNVSIYLPYVGVKDLDTSIIMNSDITLKAILDIWSGDLLYVIKINNKSMAYKYLASSGLVYRFQGNCGKQVPIGKIDNSNQLMAMTGSMASMGVGLAMGNPMMALGGAAGLIGASAMPPKVSMTGGITGAIGRGDTDEAYLIITQSVPVYPNNWRSEIGAPRYQEFQVSDLSGYTEFYEVHADDVSDATDSEKAEIENLLKSGVFIE